MRIWLKQDTACFLESHAKFFEHLGNVYKLMVYDNTRVAVKKLAGAEGEPTEALHYRYITVLSSVSAI